MHLTQAELARRAGIKQPTLSLIETGTTRALSGQTMVGLAKALNTTPDWIMHGRGIDDIKRYSEEAVAVMVLFEQLNEANKAAAIATIEALSRTQAQPEDRRITPDRRNNKH